MYSHFVLVPPPLSLLPFAHHRCERERKEKLSLSLPKCRKFCF